ncbi:MAG: hypothetical protein AAF281_02985 [Pseudomonadota bacterium]
MTWSWLWMLLLAMLCIGGGLLALKRIRKHERQELDAPNLVLTEEGKLLDADGDDAKPKADRD